MANPHVALVIDNDDEVLQELKNMLESLGHQCSCASTQEEAERILAKQGFCYVLLDLELPVSPNQIPKIQVGFNLLEVIRARYSKDKLPVIVITAHGKGHEYPVRAFKMGADDYVKKPFDNEPEPLEDKIRDWTQKTCEKIHGDCPNLRAARGSKQKLAVPVKGKGADGKTSRRALIGRFIETVWSTTGRRIKRTDIWRAVGHSSPRQFQFWQAHDGKATAQDDQNFRRILAMKPTDFMALLKKKDVV